MLGLKQKRDFSAPTSALLCSLDTKKKGSINNNRYGPGPRFSIKKIRSQKIVRSHETVDRRTNGDQPALDTLWDRRRRRYGLVVAVVCSMAVRETFQAANIKKEKCIAMEKSLAEPWATNKEVERVVGRLEEEKWSAGPPTVLCPSSAVGKEGRPQRATLEIRLREKWKSTVKNYSYVIKFVYDRRGRLWICKTAGKGGPCEEMGRRNVDPIRPWWMSSIRDGREIEFWWIYSLKDLFHRKKNPSTRQKTDPLRHAVYDNCWRVIEQWSHGCRGEDSPRLGRYFSSEDWRNFTVQGYHLATLSSHFSEHSPFVLGKSVQKRVDVVFMDSPRHGSLYRRATRTKHAEPSADEMGYNLWISDLRDLDEHKSARWLCLFTCRNVRWKVRRRSGSYCVG